MEDRDKTVCQTYLTSQLWGVIVTQSTHFCLKHEKLWTSTSQTAARMKKVKSPNKHFIYSSFLKPTAGRSSPAVGLLLQRAVKKMLRCLKCVFLQQTDILNPVTAGYDAADSHLSAALKYLLVLQPAAVEASAEASNTAGSSTSSDSAEVVEATAVSTSQVDPAAADLTEDQLTAPDPAGLDKGSSEEPEEDGDELKQVCDLRLNQNYVVV